MERTKRAEVARLLQEKGGVRRGNARAVSRETGVPEADVYGVGTFFHLLAEPDTTIRICQDLSCRLYGAEALLEKARELDLPVSGCQCLAACDRPVAVLRERRVLPEVGPDALQAACGDVGALQSDAAPDDVWMGRVGPVPRDPDALAIDLLGERDFSGTAYQKVMESDPEAILDEIEASGLQGRGGAGFPAHVKWRSVRGQADACRYVVLNADEGEPGTFKDREIMVRRPDRVLEGLAIAARIVGASDIYCYLRGEFEIPWMSMAQAIEEVDRLGLYPGLRFHLHAGHGAYICGEETALLEALEGKRGMPRLKPPFPTEVGLWGKPTLVHNVETIACVPSIVMRSGRWFADLGRTGAGTKLYCISGHIRMPGVYELPLGVSLDELVEAAGGYVGTLKAFSPGGASSGFLPATERGRPLDFRSLADVGSMLGSAGVVVMNESVSIPWAAGVQLAFFEAESCGQCAPCRIGTRFQASALMRMMRASTPPAEREKILAQMKEVAWEMEEGSICGLGQIAALPLTSALRWFPEEFVS